MAVRWYLRFGLSYRDVEELLASRPQRLKQRLRPMRGLRVDRTAQSSSPGSRSCRTCVAATTNSPPRPHTRYASPPRSPNSPRRSDRSFATASRCPPISECNCESVPAALGLWSRTLPDCGLTRNATGSVMPSR